MRHAIRALPLRFAGAVLAGTLDTIGTAAHAFGDLCLAACEEVGSVLDEHTAARKRDERNRRLMSKAARDIERIPVTERTP